MAEEKPETTSEAQGDASDKDAAAASEAAGGGNDETTEQRFQREREELLNEASERAYQRLRSERTQQPAADTPPTPTRGGGDTFEQDARQEALAIRNEQSALDAAVAKDGWTNENVVRDSQLTRRISTLQAVVTNEGLKRNEDLRQVEALGTEDRWKEYRQQHSDVRDLKVLRKAFLQEESERTPANGKPKPATPAPREERTRVDASGPHEVTASQLKTRMMTRDSWTAAKDNARSKGDMDTVAQLDREWRNGTIIEKK